MKAIQTYNRRVLTICASLALAILFLVRPLPQAGQNRPNPGWRVTIKEGKTARSTLSINNRCKAPHEFSVDNKIKYLRFEQPTGNIPVGPAGSARLDVVFDAAGLKLGVHRDKVVVKCKECKKENGCTQDRDEIPVEVTVVKRAIGALEKTATIANKAGPISQRNELTAFTSTPDGIMASYQSDFATLTMEIHVANDQIKSTVRDDSRKVITQLEIPAVERELTSEESLSAVEAGFRSSPASPQLERLDRRETGGLLWSYVQFAEKVFGATSVEDNVAGIENRDPTSAGCAGKQF